METTSPVISNVWNAMNTKDATGTRASERALKTEANRVIDHIERRYAAEQLRTIARLRAVARAAAVAADAKGGRAPPDPR